MWLLIVIVLMFDASLVPVVSKPMATKTTCQAAAQDALKLRERGLHVISAQCERRKEA